MALGIWSLFRPTPNPQDQLKQARLELAKGNYQRALDLAGEIPTNSTEHPDALLLAGESATRLTDFPAAIDYYQQYPAEGSNIGTVQFALGNVLLHAGRVSDAIDAFRQVLKHRPTDSEARSRIGFLLAASGQSWKAREEFSAVASSGAATARELALMTDPERPVQEGDYLAKCLKSHPEDVLTQLGMAADLFDEGKSSSASELLRSVQETRPDLLVGQALLGESLLDRNKEFQQWHAELPAAADSFADIWHVRGLYARATGQNQMAIGCFAQALQLEPFHRRATYQLGRLLTEADHSLGSELSNRARRLYDLSDRLFHVVGSDGTAEIPFREAVELLLQMRRFANARDWLSLALNQFPNQSWPPNLIAEYSTQLSDPPATPSIFELLTISDYPKFAISSATDSTNTATNQQAAILFSDSKAIPEFIYNNGADETTKGARMQEQTGGGGSFIDIDRDLWPDLYLVQGNSWPSSAPSPESELSDYIMRNRFGTKLTDVSQVAGIHESGFGQSAAVGDLDNDGFPDVYVANIGTNALWINNGDGTFSKQPLDASTGTDVSWTSSAMIADIDGDGISDIVDCNYVQGASVYSEICSGRACSPQGFKGTPDRIRFGNGDGTFEVHVPKANASDAKGLGLLAYRNVGETTLNIFVANDQVPNFHYRTSVDDARAFEDTAFGSGLGYTQDGLLTAAMGIAATDLDQNGLIDFFITNFMGESNTLYLQRDAGFFFDATRVSRLAEPGKGYVGWGTQFFDVDLDGDDDLAIVNGHVDDYTDEPNGQYAMPSLMLVNNGGVFSVADLEENAGNEDPLQRTIIGRSLAKADWNGDGKTDLLLLPIGSPAILTTNETQSTGHFLNIKLSPSRGARDPVGAHVEIVCGNEGTARVGQFVAGDGFHAHNEAMLQFGLGECRHVSSVKISWRSGNVTELTNVPIDCLLTVGENRTFATAWRARHPTTIPATVP